MIIRVNLTDNLLRNILRLLRLRILLVRLFLILVLFALFHIAFPYLDFFELVNSLKSLHRVAQVLDNLAFFLVEDG